MRNVNGLSGPEADLMRAVGCAWFITLVERGSLIAPNAWKQCALEVFVTGTRGPEVDALRRVVQACWDREPLRHTPEFDALCSFDERAAEVTPE